MTIYTGEYVDNENTPALLVGVQNGTASLDICIAISVKIGSILPQNPAILLLDIYPNVAQVYQKDMCSTMFMATLFLIERIWKQPKCPLIEE